MKNKLEYIWDYYKLHIAGGLILVIIVFSLLSKLLFPKQIDLYVGIVNVTAGSDLQSELITKAPLEIKAYKDLILSDLSQSKDLEYAVASQTKILAAVTAGQLDIVIMNEDAFAAFSQNDYLLDIEEYLDDKNPNLKDSYQGYFCKNVDLTDEDNPREYTSAIDISCSPIIQRAQFSDKVYLGIIKNTQRDDAVVDYLTYLLNG